MDFVLIWKFLSIFILSNILLGVNVRLFYIINISRHLPQQVIKMLVFCGSQNLFWGRERERERAVSKWIAKFTRKYVRKNLFQGLEAENSQKVPHHKLFLGIFMNFSRTCILQNTHKALLLNWPKTLWKLLIMLTNFERLTHCTNYHHFLFKSWSQRTLWKCNFVRGFWANQVNVLKHSPHKTWSLPSRTSLVNVKKSPENCVFGSILVKISLTENFIFCAVILFLQSLLSRKLKKTGRFFRWITLMI